MVNNKGICSFCGKEFEYKKRLDGKGYIKTKYCSEECLKRKAEQDTQKDIENKKYGWGKCEYCGKLFQKEKKLSGRGYKERKFCSVDCENKHHRKISEQNYGYGTCVVCGKTFKKERTKSYYSGSMFCSEECRNQYADEKYPNRVVYCAYCGKRTPLKSYGSKNGSYINVKFCDSECENKYYKEVYGKKQCKQCGKDFYVPTYINNRGQREYKRGFIFNYCDECRQKLPRTSENEQDFALILQQNNIDYDRQEFRIDNFYYDFHITNFNILIDVNPSFTHTTKESFMNKGKSKNYHYDRLETAAKAGYLYICVWDWSNISSIINILKQAMVMKTKYELQEHKQPKLLYCKKTTGELVTENEALSYAGSDSYYYLPIYNCGRYKYKNLDYYFDIE